MGKKKKSKNNALALDLLGSPQPGDVSAPADYKREEIDSPFVLSASVLEERLRTRKIPLVDDGIREKDIRNPPPDVVEEWYREAHVGKYVHMEQVIRDDGGTYTTKRVQFEFSRMLKE